MCRSLHLNNAVCNIILCYVRQLLCPYLASWHSPHFILATAGFPEVCDGRELSMDGLPVKPPVVQLNHGLLCVLFVAELQKGRQDIKGVSERRCMEHMDARTEVLSQEQHMFVSGCDPKTHLDIHISYKMIPQVVTNIHLLHLAVLLLHLCEHLLCVG